MNITTCILLYFVDDQEEKYVREAETLKEEVGCALKKKQQDPFDRLELIDLINKLGLSHYFENEISECVNEIACIKNISICMHHYHHHLLYFRILRQYGYHVPQGTARKLN